MKRENEKKAQISDGKERKQKKHKLEEISKREKKSKSKIIIILCLVVFLVALSIGGYFWYQYNELKKPIKEDWGQKYYMYLKDVNENKKEEDAGLPKNLKESTLSFFKIENIERPVMVIDYEKDKQEYSNVYFISKNKVNVLIYNQPSKVELLYNIQNKKYDYYSHIVENNSNRYKSIAEQINETIAKLEKARKKSSENETIEEGAEYTFDSQSTEKVTDLNGKEISLDKFDETFVKPDIKTETVYYSTDLKEKDLKSKITKGVSEYKTVEEVITKQIEKKVEKKVQEVLKTKEAITNAKAEIEKKEAEERARKEAEEREKQEREGFKVGSYTLKYGRYEWDLAEVGDAGRKETYILKSDKTCTHTDYEGKTTSCTFTTGRATDGQSIESMVIRDALIIYENDGYSRSYFPKNDGFRDTDLENFLYKGAN